MNCNIGNPKLEALSDEQKELLEKFCATEIELNGISEREAFTTGFKIAMRLAVFFSKLNARYRLKNGKIYVIIRY